MGYGNAQGGAPAWGCWLQDETLQARCRNSQAQEAAPYAPTWAWHVVNLQKWRNREVVIAIMMLILVERSFSLVSELPNKVLAWIGGRTDLMDNDALGRVRTGMVAGAAGAGAVGGAAVQAIPGTKGLRNILNKFNKGEKDTPQNKGGGNDPTSQ